MLTTNKYSAYAVRNKNTGAARRKRTRNRIISAATEIIIQQGPDRPVIDDFISFAGVSRGTFYNYFKTKEELLEAASEELGLELVKTYEKAKAKITNPAERLAGGVRFLIHSSRQNRRLGLLYMRNLALTVAEVEMRNGPLNDLKDCISLDILPEQNLEVAVDLVVAVITEGVRTAMTAERPMDYPEQIATLLLTALGISRDEAAEISRRPLLDIASSSA